jgi:hypothetical protein
MCRRQLRQIARQGESLHNGGNGGGLSLPVLLDNARRKLGFHESFEHAGN